MTNNKSYVAELSSRPLLLIVVDDNRRFAIHVYRHLTCAMEFGFSKEERATFAKVSPDGRLEVRWLDPIHDESLGAYTALLDEACKHPAREVWTLIDVRGVGKPRRELASEPNAVKKVDWKAYYEAFAKHSGDSKRAWVVSAYGHRWRDVAEIRPKSVDTLSALREEMGLRESIDKSPKRASREDVAILLTGAGFELKADTTQASTGIERQVDIGFPATGALLRAMSPAGETQAWVAAGDSRGLPGLANIHQPESPALQNLDLWWDVLLAHVHAKRDEKEAATARDPATTELVWREAFRRALLAHDFGHQVQSLAAARLDFDYWISTNYSRFADRAIDLVNDLDCVVANQAGGPLHWRAITTPIEADAVSRDLSSKRDVAATNRVLLKLHGDVGHTWTMAVAGGDKRPGSTYSVRPELHRMYIVAQAMLTETLWARNARSCSWHIVGHGLRDHALVRLMATVIARSPRRTHHHIHLVAPSVEQKKKTEKQQRARQQAALDELKARFREAGEAELADSFTLNAEPFEKAGDSAIRSLLPGGRFFTRVDLDAVGYMSRLSADGLDPVKRPTRTGLRPPRVPRGAPKKKKNKKPSRSR